MAEGVPHAGTSLADLQVHGFRQSPSSGLLVPEEVSRERQVWTRDEWKVLDRCGKLLKSRGLQMLMYCEATPECKAQPTLQKIKQPDGFILRCAHADRLFTSMF